MKNYFLYGLEFILVFLTACKKEDILPEFDMVEISTQIIPIKSTRIHISEEGFGSFSQSDRIMLFIAPQGSVTVSTQELTCTGTGWTPQLTWNDLHTNKASFAAVYPSVRQTENDEFIHEVAVNQSKYDSYRISDLLFAQTTAQKGERVNLDFYHKMNHVVVYLSSKNGAFTAQELASATVTMKAYCQIEFNPLLAQLGAVKGNMETVTFHQVSNSTFHAIACPQPILANWRNEGWIEISIGKRKLVYKAPQSLNGGIPFNNLESGKQIIFNIVLDKSEIGGEGDEVDWRNKTCWVYGVKNIPPISQWGYYLYPKLENGKPVNEIFALEWKREYGWYDCNKLNPTGPEFGDQNLCWAATCSNMIYWWLEHNTEYLECYGYKGPYKYVSDKDCEVFKFFKDNFTDSGLHINIGLDWFFRGAAIPTGNNARPTKHHPGFFKDVIDVPVSENVSRGGYDLSKNLKRAFLEKKAIGISILLNKGSAAHAITIWGASFDEKGEVNILYVVENNDIWANQNPWPMAPGKESNAGIFTKRVKIDQVGKAFIEGGNPGVCSIEIDYLTLLGLHTEKWEAFFNRLEDIRK